MASASVSELIIFIAAVSIAAAVSGAMVTTVGDISNSVDEQGADIASDIDTDIEIISDPASGAVYDDTTEEVTLLVKNTGRRAIATDGADVEILINGQYIPSSAYTVETYDEGSWQSGSPWREGSVARIVVSKSLPSDDHRATVIVRSEEETLRFRTSS